MLDPNSRKMNEADFRHAASTLGLALVVFIFVANDIFNIFVKDGRVWMLLDYTCVRLPTVLVFLWLLRTGAAKPADFGLIRQPALPFLATFVGMTAAGILILKFLGPVMANTIAWWKIGTYPEIKDPVWKQVDLWFGIMSTGFTEELIFRGFMYTKLMEKFNDEKKALIISSLIFGLIHWSLGPHFIVCTGLVGAAFMIFYMRTKATPALMLAHFAIDYYFFSGLASK